MSHPTTQRRHPVTCMSRQYESDESGCNVDESTYVSEEALSYMYVRQLV